MSPGSTQLRPRQAGQTIIALLIFILLIISLTTVAVTVTIINIRSNTTYAGGEQALAYADSGAEDALEHLRSDPAYSGQSLVFAHGAVTINITGTTEEHMIVSTGTSATYHRTVTVTATTVGGVVTVTNWNETP